MIAARRLLAFVLLPFLTVAFLVALFAGRVDATLLNSAFLLRHAEDAGLYAVVHDEGIPAFVDDLLARQEEALPENLQHANLPTDAAASARISELVQTLLPEAFLRDLVEEVANAILPYVTGKADEFEVTLSLHDPLVAVFGRSGDAPSVFEAAWKDLDVSERLIRGFAQAAVEDGEAPAEASDEPGGASAEDPPGLLSVVSQDIDGAAAWWDREFFTFVDGLLPFLVGDSSEIDLHIDFTDYPALAYAFAGPLQSDVRTLQRDGWRFTDEDLHARLAEAQDVSIEDIDERLAIFRPGGMTFDERDFAAWQEQTRQEALADPARTGEAPPDFTQQRQVITRVRLAGTWGASAVAAALVVLVGILGGRSWTGRLAWGSAGLAVASGVALLLAVPIYAAAALPRLERRLDSVSADEDSAIPGSVREALAERGLAVVQDLVGGMQWRAAGWFILALAGLAFAFAWRQDAVRSVVGRAIRRPSGAYEPPATGEAA